MVGDKWHSLNGGDKYGSVFYLKTGGPCFTYSVNLNHHIFVFICLHLYFAIVIHLHLTAFVCSHE
ncbi:hypothetical protein BpHYR1_027422 [Brachionus plicatilis]|uniref:Uncharacterized protein n=1 Tax=Brachionus plicatilis TaxID=10195 RepID=A0A3M7SRS8_BRAPC|nr:hypothetical protein BpHYR1_027422 [Brachionus plicatilis]